MTKRQTIAENNDNMQVQYRKDFLERMERKWELKKSLQDSRHHRHLLKFNRQPGYQ